MRPGRPWRMSSTPPAPSRRPRCDGGRPPPSRPAVVVRSSEPLIFNNVDFYPSGKKH